MLKLAVKDPKGILYCLAAAIPFHVARFLTIPVSQVCERCTAVKPRGTGMPHAFTASPPTWALAARALVSNPREGRILGVRWSPTW